MDNNSNSLATLSDAVDKLFWEEQSKGLDKNSIFYPSREIKEHLQFILLLGLLSKAMKETEHFNFSENILDRISSTVNQLQELVNKKSSEAFFKVFRSTIKTNFNQLPLEISGTYTDTRHTRFYKVLVKWRLSSGF